MIINSAKYCTLNQFIECKYENNLTILGVGTPDELQSAWEMIQLEYLHLVGIDVPTANLEINIANTTNRINAMKARLFVQRDCIQRFGIPLVPELPAFEKYGYTVTYNGNNDDLLNQLQTIENKEREHSMQLKTFAKRLQTLRVAQGTESESEDSRVHFINLINRLEEARGIEIDLNKMTVEKFAILYAEKAKAAKDSQKN